MINVLPCTSLRKRDGKIVAFDPEHIRKSAAKALEAAGAPDWAASVAIRNDVVNQLESVAGDSVVEIEDVQDLTEAALMQRGYAKAAKAFILYRHQHALLRQSKQMTLDIEELVGGYIDRNDWRVNENSNAGFSYASLLNHVSGSVIAHYTLGHVYPEEVAAAHRSGDLHLHDLSSGIVGYCAGWSLRSLLLEGFRGCQGRASAGPARHLDTALGQIVNFLCTLQTEWAGAQAFSSFDTLLAPFIRHDSLSYDQVKQCIQQFIFGLNIACRWGQTPFTNLTFDWVVPDDLADHPVIIGGQSQADRFGDYQREMDLINRAFLEVMIEGDRDGRIFTFPIPTYNITETFDWDSDNARLLFEVTGKYGLPYFQNFINSSLEPGDVRSMCCRLQMDVRELRNKTGGLFGSGEQTGSVGVVTINLPRQAYLARTEQELLERIGHQMDLARESLEIKRKFVERNIDNDLLPYTKHYLGSLRSHFGTIGLVGMNEACLNFNGTTIAESEGGELALRVLDFMRDRLADYQAETGHMYNLEATPAEGTSYRLARLDKQQYPDIITAGAAEPYYTNSTQLPVGHTDDIFAAFDLQDELQSRYTGGTVLHGFLTERITDPLVVANLVKRLAYAYRLPYFTITPTFSICPEHGYIAGEHHQCPHDDHDTAEQVPDQPQPLTAVS
jgi:ribonucleoside-triphosphate reductase